jgi:outer membrane immunogenic protein
MRRLFWYCISVCLVLTFTPGLGYASNYFDGPYIGGLVGYSHYSSDLSAEGNVKGLSADGPQIGAFIGYGLTTGRVFLSSEINVIFNTADFKLVYPGYKLTADIEESYGISVRMGGFISNQVLSYFTVGWQQTNLSFDQVTDFGSGSTDKKFDGPRIGVGIEYQTNKYVFIRGEYNYTFYREETVAGLDLDLSASHFQIGAGFRF